jgi:NADPH:quinone reductase-like Zn-dependent oxidoreductase
MFQSARRRRPASPAPRPHGDAASLAARPSTPRAQRTPSPVSRVRGSEDAGARYIAPVKAAFQDRYGPPEVVRIMDVDQPVAGAGELLVRVHATTVNRTDCGFRSGKPRIVRLFAGLRRPKAKVLGNEFAGVVEAIGGDVNSFAVGDRVFGYVEGTFGAHAEFLTVPADACVATMPASMSFEQTAPSNEGSHYALSWIRKAKVGKGDDALVNGATGAIGSAAVQLLKHLGAHVTAVCATPHVPMVEGLGADRVIDYTAKDFTQDAHRYDFVLDAVGKSSFGRCKQLLKPHGIYLSSEFGPRLGNPFLALITPLLRGRRVMFPIPRHDQATVQYFKELLESGAFKPVIDRTYPLEQIVDAYRYVETGQKIGNVVIVVPSSSV